MKLPLHFTGLCLLCAGAGFLAGPSLLPGSKSGNTSALPRIPAVPDNGRAVAASPESIPAVPLTLSRAEQMITGVRNGDVRGLAALLDSVADDPVLLEFLWDARSKSDPDTMVKALASCHAIQSAHRFNCHTLLIRTLERWSARDPEAAWSAALALPTSLKNSSAGRLAGLRMKSDRLAGLKLLQQCPGAVYLDIPDFAGPAERAEALPLVMQLADGATKNRLLSMAVKGLPVAEAMSALNQSRDLSGDMAKNAMLRKAATESPSELVEFYKNASGSDRYKAARYIGETLVKTDAAAAVDWAAEHLSGFWRKTVINKAAESLDKADPAAAAKARALLPGSP